MAKETLVEIEIIKNGVFVAEDEQRDIGAVEKVSADVANALVKSGHAKRK